MTKTINCDKATFGWRLALCLRLRFNHKFFHVNISSQFKSSMLGLNSNSYMSNISQALQYLEKNSICMSIFNFSFNFNFLFIYLLIYLFFFFMFIFIYSSIFSFSFILILYFYIFYFFIIIFYCSHCGILAWGGDPASS